MRRGKLVDMNDPIYLLDQNRGTCRIPTLSGEWLTLVNLKRKNRTAYDANYVEIILDGKRHRIQKDELMEALTYA